jgi:hypothetical protein
MYEKHQDFMFDMSFDVPINNAIFSKPSRQPIS